MSNDTALAALDRLEAGGFTLGTDFDAAHDICQRHEGEWAFDWVHAIVHRIEGDDANAAYWYRRAGQDRHSASIAEEVAKARIKLQQER